MMLEWKERRFFSAIADGFKVVRKAGGAVGVDAVVFLLLYFASQWRQGGLRGFAEAHAAQAEALGAMMGRSKLVGQSVLSNLLRAVTMERAETLGRLLLQGMPDAQRVMQSPALQTLDARGRGWHVFDFDPNREVYRQRSLYRDPDSPSGARKLDNLASPGHRGRQRGEVVLTQGLLSHAGSGLWVGASVAPGNDHPQRMMASAVASAVACSDALHHPRERVLLRADGEFRGVPSFHIAQEAGIGFLTRMSRYELLEEVEVLQRMQEATWERVDDSGAGPVRFAADLGVLELRAAQSTLDQYGERFSPVSVRVVVTRYPGHEDAKRTNSRGHYVEGWIYELFGATGVEACDWPASDLVSAYYGRSLQENRFAQLDREMAIDRRFSDHGPGHLVAVLCAMATWNWQIISALRTHPLPAHPPQRARVTEQIPPPPQRLTSEPPRANAEESGSKPDRGTLREAMMQEDVVVALTSRGLRLDADSDEVVGDHCDRWRISSAYMDRVTPSLRLEKMNLPKGERKFIQIKVPTAAMHPIREALQYNRQHSAMCSAGRMLRSRHPDPHTIGTPSLRWCDAQTTTVYTDRRALSWPLFIPSKARQMTRQNGQRCKVRVTVRQSRTTKVTPHPLCAASRTQVRRQRWNWTERVAARATPTDMRVSTVVTIGSESRRYNST